MLQKSILIVSAIPFGSTENVPFEVAKSRQRAKSQDSAFRRLSIFIPFYFVTLGSLLKLHLVIMRIDAVLFDELLVGASFGDAAVGDYQDFIRIADGGEAVGNGNGGAVLGKNL